MAIAHERRITPFGTWALRIALSSATLIVTAILFHRFFGMGTPVALNLITLAYIGATISVLLVGAAAIAVWRHGVRGKFASTMALLVSLAMFVWPASYLPVYFSLPQLNDVSTDIQVPPKFATLAELRQPGTNSVAFPAERAKRSQRAAYPDIRSLEVDRSSEEAFELALDALRRQGISVVSERPPDMRTGRPGFIEAKDRTLVVGFEDDVIVRIAGDGRRARFDVRSASRYGRHDLGRNADRIRRILKEFHARVEATVATAEERNFARGQRRGLRNFKALKRRSRAKKSAAQRN